ncbi:TonB-dependent receptor [Sphingomonas sp. CBMAI 2297]|uniref:TonB-dependent receptor n=1 Tax=Sphingomonas sp. CBMAI 2297 TaxID=2991720 RepID=UPI002457DE83|nr:TonB-dependent receptor [Sphingomonas sp. CBMAI 2297]MDH4746504.1 TonB-dependent receptor [Sphingomonas sp. CBMAI 2297]
MNAIRRRRSSFALAASAMTIALAGIVPSALAQDAAASGRAQANAGILSGRVHDENGSPLPGARVVVPELGSETTTDLQGEFVMPVPAQGEVTVRVEYLGRPNASTSVALADRRTVVDITVPRDAASDIVVTGASIVDNTARALNQQRQADNTVSIVSADAIGRFPDPNIAEALQRVSGIGIERDQGEGRYINIRGAPMEFSTVSVDGATVAAASPTTRAIDLDTIPSDIVANLEVTKSLLPSQDADAIAGSVNISTRSAFDSKGFRLSASAGASYNDYGGTSDRRASLSVSNRFGADRQFGVLLAGSYSKTDRQLDNVENGWAVNAAGQVRLVETLFKDYDTKRERLSLNGALEWRPSPGNRLYARGSFSQFTDDEYRNRLSILWSEGTMAAGSTDTRATFTNTRIEKQIRHRVQRNQIYTGTVGGENLIGRGRIEYSATYSESKQTYPRRDELLFRSSLRPTLSYDFANPDNPSYSLFTTNEHLQSDRYAFRENAYRSNNTLNKEWGFSTKVELPVDLGGQQVLFSLGGRYRDRDVVSDEERFRDRRASTAPSGSLTSFLNDERSANFNYDLGYKIDPGKADAYFDATKGSSERRIPQSITADYRASEKILGMFGMAKAEFGHTTVIAGVRYERTDFQGSAPTVALNGTVGKANVDTDYGKWFPNLTVRQAFTPELIGRFALSRGINRPNFVDLVPRQLDETDSSMTRITEGNPNLRPTLSNNVDAGLEYYIRPVGLISVNAFYKDLTDYRYTLSRTAGNIIYVRPENAPDGHLVGIEVNWQQQFTFLPGLLSGFGVFANYTWTDAEIRLSQTFAGRRVMPLPGQSKSSWNAALFYEKGPFNARLSYTKRSDYLNAVDANDPRLDLYWEGRGQLDATASYQVVKQATVFVEAKNLTNSPGVRYYGVRERVYEYEKFGYSIFGGVRIKL